MKLNYYLILLFSLVLISATKLPQTDIAVTGIDSPSSRKRRDIPDFFPIKPMLNFYSFYGALPSMAALALKFIVLCLFEHLPLKIDLTSSKRQLFYQLV